MAPVAEGMTTSQNPKAGFATAEINATRNFTIATKNTDAYTTILCPESEISKD